MKKKVPFLDQLTVIPPNSFMVITTNDPVEMSMSLHEYVQLFKERNIGGIIIMPGTDIRMISTQELAKCGLQRIPRVDVQWHFGI
jgi:hypothetical protein